MSRGDVLPDEPSAQARSFQWRSLFSWGFFAALGLLVWELTDQSGWAAGVACLKVGADDAATSWYLLGKDPLRTRGIPCGLFHFSRCCTRFGLAAVALIMAIEFIRFCAQPWLGPPPPLQMLRVLLIGVMGLSVGSMFAWLGCLTSLFSPVRLWIDSTNRDSRIAKIWPPRPTGKNQVRIWVMVGAVVGSHFFGCFSVPLRMAGEWLLIFSFPAMAIVGWFIAQRIAARTPEECWCADDASDVTASPAVLMADDRHGGIRFLVSLLDRRL